MNKEQQFEAFWNEYPRRIGKRVARKKFMQLVGREVSFETVMNGVRAYCAWLRSEGKATEYTCHPTTWLNQGRWEDDLTTVRPASATDLNRQMFEDFGTDEPPELVH